MIIIRMGQKRKGGAIIKNAEITKDSLAPKRQTESLKEGALEI